MTQLFKLEDYLTNGVENIVKGAIRATFKNPRQSLFFAQFALASKEASKRRKNAEESSVHIPPFLIASITSSCNLHCQGCYSRFNEQCTDDVPNGQLSTNEWEKIFLEARSIGCSFILLAGGEPMIRRDVLQMAGTIPELLFPIFTNGTMLDSDYLALFDQHRNLIPVFSIEGHKDKTDLRRGDGVFDKINASMEMMRSNQLLFGASVTVTTENLEEVTSDSFTGYLRSLGCKVIFYVEYVPVSGETAHLAPADAERRYLDQRLNILRSTDDSIVYISFPGDEKSSGGCLAAGRGFFHINAHGNAEPCPFSPYSDISVKNTSLLDALQSKLFQKLRSGEFLMEEHAGGCVLFEKKELVEHLLSMD